MTDHSEHRYQDSARRRELTRDEEKFFGAEPDREAEEGSVHEAGNGEERYEAGAAARAAPEVERRKHTEHSEHAAHEGHTHEPADDRPVQDRGDMGDSHGEDRVQGRVDDRVDAGRPTATDVERSTPLFPAEEADSLRMRWDGIQTEFVDEPRAAVEKADALVGDVMQRLADGFSSERARLERDWDRGDGVSTEDLRVALKRYRSFFDRLLSI